MRRIRLDFKLFSRIHRKSHQLSLVCKHRRRRQCFWTERCICPFFIKLYLASASNPFLFLVVLSKMPPGKAPFCIFPLLEKWLKQFQWFMNLCMHLATILDKFSFFRCLFLFALFSAEKSKLILCENNFNSHEYKNPANYVDYRLDKHAY